MINKHVVSEQAVDTRILDMCIKQRKPQVAKAYLRCLESNGYALNIYALSKYLELYLREEPTSDSEEHEIISIFDRIEKECKYIPLVTLRPCIAALCRTYKWEKTLELIKDNRMKEIGSTALSFIIIAAFKHGNVSTGLKLLYEMDDLLMASNKYPSMYDAYLNHYVEKEPEKFDKAVTKIFKFWKQFDTVPIKGIVDKFMNACNKAGWVANYVTIKRDGNCHRCSKQLSQMTIDDTIFKKLAKSVLSKTLVETDIFRSTTPEELNKFKNFIHKTKPYDIVIDGLNVTRGQADCIWLKELVNHFSQDNKKILVIARQHMYPASKWISTMENAYIYFLQNITQDDPYILYATLMSGVNAKFLSFDFFRQHIHKIESRSMRKIFRRWQYTHQYLWHYDTSAGKLILERPWLYEPYPQCNETNWHIPYRMDSEKSKLLYRPVDTWVCFQAPQK
ncbi:hypothetical protein KPH14_010693 [Odynerus spinipes]|uniref:ribonuclease P n=1 Tax=Odynerus spinipes TaxID=1348599 RepID=A0AAD9RVF5_9HYME|nr:hypothetical protein KPH14_010693 [Odynerus spinipes]